MILQSVTRVFLVAYLFLLVYHIFLAGIPSLYVLSALFAGCVVALIAHQRAGRLTIFFLVAHMAFEWYHHAKHGFVYGGSELLLHVIHVVFDGMFLVYQSYAISKRYWWMFVTAVTGALIVLTSIAYVPVQKMHSFAPHLMQMQSHTHVHTYSFFDMTLLGGILGCVLMHLFREATMSPKAS